MAKRRGGSADRRVGTGVGQEDAGVGGSKKSRKHLPAVERRVIAAEIAEEYAVRTVCRVLRVASSGHYYQPEGRDEATLRAAIEERTGRWPTYGYRRITAELKRAGWSVNHKQVARLMAAMGVQYAAQPYVDHLRGITAAISMSNAGAAWQNACAERFIRTIKEDEIDLSEYEDYADALNQLGHFLNEIYMHKRIHSALGYLTPVEFESLWLSRQSSQAFVSAHD